MRILLAGDWHSLIHEESCAAALAALGVDVIAFPWHSYFDADGSWIAPITNLAKRAQNKYLRGPLVDSLNRDLVALARQTQPDAVFIYRGTHIVPKTLRDIRSSCPGTVLIGYNNDDPFSDLYRHQAKYWRHFLSSVPEYDLVYAYRPRNVRDLEAAGAKATGLLMPWFEPTLHQPMQLTQEELERYGCDVVFVGHYEADERIKVLNEIARAGLDLKIWGPPEGWRDALASAPNLGSVDPVKAVRGTEYSKALCGSRVALAFYSKLNRDGYSRRSFEIPATKTLLLSRRTPELEAIYEDGVEVLLFDTPEEAAALARHCVDDFQYRNSVAEAGYRAVHRDEHSSVGRMNAVISAVRQLHGDPSSA